MRLNTIPLHVLTQSGGGAEKISLPANEVHVWQASLSVRGTALCACWDLLSPEEIRIAASYGFAKDRREFVVRRALLRQILARYSGRAAADLCFDFDPSGKPILRETPSLHFSASHSQDFALLAISHNRVGIDLQYMESGVLRQTLIEQCLSRPERSYLQALPVKARTAALYRSWTQKEAILKALGVGLLCDPRNVNVIAGFRKPHVVSALERKWLVRQVAAPIGYAAAAAIEDPNRKLGWRQWEFPVERVHV